MNLPQKVAVNTAVQIGGQVAGLFIGLLTLRLTTGYLGVDAFGQLSIVLALGSMLVTISDLGVTTTLARELAKAPERADALGGQLLRFRVLSIVVIVCFGFLLLPVLPYDSETKVALAISFASVVFASLATFPRAFFQTHLRLHLQAAVDLLTKVLALVAILVVIALTLGLQALVGLLVAASAAGALLAFSLSRRFWSINLQSDWTQARPLIRDSIGIGVVSMIGLLHLRGDAFLLSLMKPAADVGVYAVAFRFVEQAFFLPGLFLAAIFPILARYVHQADERLNLAINLTFQALVLGSVAVTLFVFILAPTIVQVIATSEFDAAITPTRILAFSLVFVFVSTIFYNLLFAVNRQRELIVIGLFAVALNVALNLVLIPKYSYNGAAVATVVSEGVSFGGSFVVARRMTKFRLDRLFLLRAAAAAGAAALVAAVSWDGPRWFVLLLAELTFVTVAFASGAVRKTDLRFILRREER